VALSAVDNNPRKGAHMKMIRYTLAAVLVSSCVGITHAEETADAPQPGPMMYGPPGPQGQPPMMNPQMRERMMRMRQHRQMMMQQQAGQPQGDAPGPGGDQYACPHYKGGMGMMRGQKMMMMRERMEMMDKHMQSIESHLANIEELMKKMIEKMD
jgi:hypothetical protein